MSEVRAEMSATVLRVHVGPGDQVEAEDPIITLESMKMEIPVVAPGKGVVLSVEVAEGAMVDEGSLLATIDQT